MPYLELILDECFGVVRSKLGFDIISPVTVGDLVTTGPFSLERTVGRLRQIQQLSQGVQLSSRDFEKRIAFVSHLTNSYYGGQIEAIKEKRSEFTSTEERLIEIVSEGLNRMLEKAWYDLMPITLVEQSREVNPQFTSFVDGSDLVIICSFVVQLPEIDAATFDIIYPLQTLKPIASQLRRIFGRRHLSGYQLLQL